MASTLLVGNGGGWETLGAAFSEDIFGRGQERVGLGRGARLVNDSCPRITYEFIFS